MTKTVLITGGSSGIGLEISKYFARDDYQILWVSLLQKELDTAKSMLLKEYSNCNIHTLAINLSNEKSSSTVYEWTKQNGWKVDVLINSAGFGTYGPLNSISIDRERDMIGLNITNLYLLTRYFLDDMIANNSGKILNIASSASYHTMPNMSTYAATKSFVRQFSESLHLELKYSKSKVVVSCLCPGPIIDTAFKQASGMDKARTFNSGMVSTTQEEVAKDAYHGLMKGKRIILTGWKYRWSHYISKISPRFIEEILIKREVDPI